MAAKNGTTKATAPAAASLSCAGAFTVYARPGSEADGLTPGKPYRVYALKATGDRLDVLIVSDAGAWSFALIDLFTERATT